MTDETPPVEPVPDPAPPTPQTPTTPAPQGPRMRDQTRWFVIGTGALMAIGSFLPWGRAGIFTVAGTDGDGIFTLVLGVVVAIIGIIGKASFLTGLIVLGCGAIGVWIAGSILMNVSGDPLGDVQAGGGLILTVLASLIAAIAGIQVVGDSRKAA